MRSPTEKPGDRSLTIATSCDDTGFAQVSVSDRGSGIATSVKERMFQPFVTTKSTGTGLGLSICRSIIERHGGHFIGRQQSGSRRHLLRRPADSIVLHWHERTCDLQTEMGFTLGSRVSLVRRCFQPGRRQRANMNVST